VSRLQTARRRLFYMGEVLFHLVCQRDLEGIVATRKFDPCLTMAWWLRVRNHKYSRWADAKSCLSGNGTRNL
jgi:hypothetical protein